MDKKKLIEYTRLIRPIARKKGLLSASQLVELFLSEHPNFFDEPNPVKESFDELFQSKENQSQTGSCQIEYTLTGKWTVPNK